MWLVLWQYFWLLLLFIEVVVLHSVFEAVSELHKAVWLPKPCIRFSTLLLLAYD